MLEGGKRRGCTYCCTTIEYSRLELSQIFWDTLCWTEFLAAPPNRRLDCSPMGIRKGGWKVRTTEGKKEENGRWEVMRWYWVVSDSLGDRLREIMFWIVF